MRSTYWPVFFSSILLSLPYPISFVSAGVTAKGSFDKFDLPIIKHTDATVDTAKSALDDYMWPTDASRVITSTFGEYRQTHFHAGIDISTNNKTGYKVFAAQDGYVWRIEVSSNGYGKMLYIKHKGGYITAYAHLKRFNNEINAIVRREQLRLERYPVEIILDSTELRVKKGEFIAYTGSSGIGTPHLHFEIRDEHLNPVNPLLFQNLAVDDSIPPFIRSLSISPLDENSSVAGSRQPLIVKALTKQGHLYRIPQKIVVSGKIGLGINVRDRINGTYHRIGIYRLELYLDDSLTFATKFDRLPAKESRQVLLYYDLPLIKKRKGKFQKLFAEEGTSLPIFEERAPGAGIVDANRIEEGEHTFQIVCKDQRGNACEVRGRLATFHRENKAVHLSLTSGTKISDNTSQDIFTIPSDRSGWFSFDNDTLQVVYDSGAVFKPLNIRLEKEHLKTTIIYHFAPRDVLLNKGIRVFVRSLNPAKRDNASRALYFRENRRWELRPTSFENTTKYFSTTLPHTLGDVALLEDSIPPRITFLKIAMQGKRPLIRFKLYDDRSGIDAEKIKMYIDNVFIIPEVDGERWRVRYESDEQLETGKHTLHIVVKDKMNNESSLTRTFTITR